MRSIMYCDVRGKSALSSWPRSELEEKPLHTLCDDPKLHHLRIPLVLSFVRVENMHEKREAGLRVKQFVTFIEK